MDNAYRVLCYSACACGLQASRSTAPLHAGAAPHEQLRVAQRIGTPHGSTSHLLHAGLSAGSTILNRGCRWAIRWDFNQSLISCCRGRVH